MKNKLALAIAILLLSGCEITWSNALQNHTCTSEQWEKAMKETKEAMAIDTVGEKRYMQYWLGTAVIRNCTRIK